MLPNSAVEAIREVSCIFARELGCLLEADLCHEGLQQVTTNIDVALHQINADAICSHQEDSITMQTRFRMIMTVVYTFLSSALWVRSSTACVLNVRRLLLCFDRLSFVRDRSTPSINQNGATVRTSYECKSLFSLLTFRTLINTTPTYQKPER
jgi:hypothetical protein